MSPIFRRLCLPLLAAAALAACADDQHAAPQALTPTEQYPLKAEAHPDEIRLSSHASGLSEAQSAALGALADRWRDRGGGVVLIRSPVKADDPRAVHATAEAAEARLRALGIPAGRLQQAGYEPEGPGPAPVIVGFEAYQAVTPQCGRSWESLSNNKENRPMANFGCAVSANMAAQIANPADIAGPRAEDPADAPRRATVFDKYRRGETTSTQMDSQASGSASSAGSGS